MTENPSSATRGRFHRADYRRSRSLKQVGIYSVCVGKRPVLNPKYTQNHRFQTEHSTCSDVSFSWFLCVTRGLPGAPTAKKETEREGEAQEERGERYKTFCHFIVTSMDGPCVTRPPSTQSDGEFGAFPPFVTLPFSLGWLVRPVFSRRAPSETGECSAPVFSSHVLWSFPSHADTWTSKDTNSPQCFLGSKAPSSSRCDWWRAPVLHAPGLCRPRAPGRGVLPQPD